MIDGGQFFCCSASLFALGFLFKAHRLVLRPTTGLKSPTCFEDLFKSWSAPQVVDMDPLNDVQRVPN